MDAQTLIIEAYTAYRGKGISKVPAWGSEKSDTALRIANRKQREWAQDAYIKWNSLFSNDIVAMDEPGAVTTNGTTTLVGSGTYFTDYQVGDTILVSGETTRTIATITSDTTLTVTLAFSTSGSLKTFKHRTILKAGVQSYSLHRNFFLPSDKAKVTTTSNSVTYSFADPAAREDADVYISGGRPKKINFYNTISTTSQVIGGSLLMPGYYLPDDMIAATDLVQVDDPEWLLYATAAELARNDAAKDSEFPNLQGLANDRYQKMIMANINYGYEQGNTIGYNMVEVGETVGDF